MKKVTLKIMDNKGNVKREETIIYKDQKNAELGISRRIGNFIRIGFDTFEIMTQPNKITMYRYMFKAPTIVYEFKTEDVPD